jgi:hypothetical protein
MPRMHAFPVDGGQRTRAKTQRGEDKLMASNARDRMSAWYAELGFLLRSWAEDGITYGQMLYVLSMALGRLTTVSKDPQKMLSSCFYRIALHANLQLGKQGLAELLYPQKRDETEICDDNGPL